MNRKDQRKTKRATVNLLAGETVRGRMFQSLLADVSEGGLMLESPSGLEMPRSHDTMVELMLPGVPEIITARCRVIQDVVRGFFRRRCLQFVNISAIQRGHLRLYVQRVCGLA